MFNMSLRFLFHLICVALPILTAAKTQKNGKSFRVNLITNKITKKSSINHGTALCLALIVLLSLASEIS